MCWTIYFLLYIFFFVWNLILKTIYVNANIIKTQILNKCSMTSMVMEGHTQCWSTLWTTGQMNTPYQRKMVWQTHQLGHIVRNSQLIDGTSRLSGVRDHAHGSLLRTSRTQIKSNSPNMPKIERSLMEQQSPEEMGQDHQTSQGLSGQEGHEVLSQTQRLMMKVVINWLPHFC